MTYKELIKILRGKANLQYITQSTRRFPKREKLFSRKLALLGPTEGSYTVNDVRKYYKKYEDELIQSLSPYADSIDRANLKFFFKMDTVDYVVSFQWMVYPSHVRSLDPSDKNDYRHWLVSKIEKIPKNKVIENLKKIIRVEIKQILNK